MSLSLVQQQFRINVYRNLHKGGFSVRQRGKVVEHTRSIQLKDVKFLVGKASRDRVIKEHRKNVHAVVSGYAIDHTKLDNTFVIYDPYKYKTFVYLSTGLPIYSSNFAHLYVDEAERHIIEI